VARRDGRVGDGFPAEELMVMTIGSSILGACGPALAGGQAQRRGSLVAAMRPPTEEGKS
jgi:hypothetical protein